MNDVPAWANAHGWWAAFAFLFVVVFLRAQLFHWIGRLAVTGALHTRWRSRIDGPMMRRAHAFLEKWGPIGVPASFLTIGFQTAVQTAAGVARMRYAVYTLVMIPGCIAWAALYTALAEAALSLTRDITWGAIVLLSVALVAGIVTLFIRRRRTADSVARIPR